MLFCRLFWLTSWLWDMPFAMSYVGKIDLPETRIAQMAKKASLSFKSKTSGHSFSDKNL